MGESNESVLQRVRETLDSLLSEIRNVRISKEDGQPVAGRELALVATNIQQARLWAGEAMREAGFVQPYPVTEGEDSQTAE